MPGMQPQPHTRWPRSDEALLLDAIHADPRAAPSDYHAALQRAGVTRYTYDAVRLKLRNVGGLDLCNTSKRVEWVARERHERQMCEQRPDLLSMETDKAEGDFNWRDFIEPMTRLQSLAKKAAWTQDNAAISFPDAVQPIGAVVFGDAHLASWATDHELLARITDEILETPGLYVILSGDLIDMAINLRGVAEAHGDLLPAHLQPRFLDSWMAELAPRVLMAGWDNHAQMREEKGSGVSMYQHVMSRRCIFHDGIGHVDMTVGQQTYAVALSHRFRGNSMYDPCYAPARYLRMEAPDREIAIQGDLHTPGYRSWWEGGAWRTAVTSGSLQNSGYGRRHFSLKNAPIFPCIVFHPALHSITVFRTVAEWLSISTHSA